MLSDLFSLPKRLVDALDFAACAWRAAWGVQLLFAIGVATATAGALSIGLTAKPTLIGLMICLVAWAPLFGALHLVERVERKARKLIAFGLQLGPVELSLWIATITVGGVVLLLILVMAAGASMALAAFGDHRPIHLGVVGHVNVALSIALALLIAGLFATGWVLIRLSFIWGMAVDDDSVALVRSWGATRGREAVILGAGLAALFPSLLLLLAVIVLDRLGSENMNAWPAADAWLMGACAGLTAAFVQAPLLVGIFAGLERRARPRPMKRRSSRRSLFQASSL